MVQSSAIRTITLPEESNAQSGVRILTGFRKKIVEMRIRWRILQLILRHTFKVLQVARELDRRRRMVLGDHPITKLAQVGKSYHWDLYTPAFPSPAFDAWLTAEIQRIVPGGKKTPAFTNVFLAITKKCSLQCAHCFEWDVLNHKEKLNNEDLLSIQSVLEDAGTSQIQLTGGEPLLRTEAIKMLLDATHGQTEYWILTSGHKFDRALAHQLTSKGLHGILVSLDHHEAEKHNQFRGNDKSYDWALNAIITARESGLTTGMTICVSRSYVQQGMLHAYMQLARNLHVSFVQILEPKAVGHYAGKDVILTSAETSILEELYLTYNYDARYASYPIISYHGYHQRKAGCFAAGNRNVYIDTDGDVNACPFCKTKTGNLLRDGLDALLPHLQQQGCATFGKTKF